MRKELIFFHKEQYIRLSHNKFAEMGKNLKKLEMGLVPKGKSFVANITDVINSKASLIEKGQYIYLASLRNYMDVLLNGAYYLDSYKVPEVPHQVFETNRLIQLRDGKIYFYFEDN